jgi:hypothetical protein
MTVDIFYSVSEMYVVYAYVHAVWVWYRRM